jgi:hypothetical protein
VVESALRLVSMVTALIVLLSFALFAQDQISGASDHQQREIVAGAPIDRGISPAPVKRRHGQPRRFIDGAAEQLESPFRAVVSTSNAWLGRAVPAALALALYGFGIGWVARYTHGRA